MVLPLHLPAVTGLLLPEVRVGVPVLDLVGVVVGRGGLGREGERREGKGSEVKIVLECVGVILLKAVEG